MLKSREKNKLLKHLSLFFFLCLKWYQGKVSCQSNCLSRFCLVQLAILISEGNECVYHRETEHMRCVYCTRGRAQKAVD